MVGGPQVTEPDEVLVEQAQGDRAAFGTLYERYVDRIYTYLYYRTSNVCDAEDLTAKVFFQALTHLPRYRHRGFPFSAWLFRIAHNVAANWYRDRRRSHTVPLETVTLAEDGGDGLEREEEAYLVRSLVAQLPPKRQHLLLLKFVEELPNAEIGRIMGRSEGAVKGLLHRTLRDLRGRIDARRNGRRPATQ